MQLAYRERGVLDWLRAQERAMTRWRDEVAAKGGCAARDLKRLDEHRQWLALELTKLGVHAAAKGWS